MRAHAAVHPIVGLMFSLLAHVAFAQPGGGAASQARGTVAVDRLTALTAQLESAARGGVVPANLLEVAAERRRLLLATMEDAPAAALRLSLAASTRGALPPEVRGLVEQEADVQGVIEIFYEDSDTGARLRRYLRADNALLSVHFASEPAEMRTGDRVRIRGVRLDNVLAADGGSATVIQVASALPYTFGEQRALMILVNFSDKTTQPYTIQTAQSMLFTTVNAFNGENSQSQTWFTGDVVGWFTIAASSTVCDSSAIRTQAQSAAQAAGVVLSNYRRFIYAFPNNACAWWGLGQVGGSTTHAWINGSLALRVTAHELGHNFGVYHSNALECGTATLGPSCTTIEYGDPADIMGNSGLVAHFNAFQKERMGWLNYGSSLPILTVQGDGVYTIEPYTGAGTGPKALKILKSVDPTTGRRTWYYVEQRVAVGYDSALSSRMGITNGVMVHTGSESTGNSSFALDMTPETSAWTDAALPVGRTFHDPESGVTITPLSVGSSGATVDVRLGQLACVTSAPALTLSPAQGPAAVAGTTVSYAIAVTNRNNPGCSTSSFSLTTQAPGGWTATLSPASLSIAPGASATATLTVTSATSAGEGAYPMSVGVTDLMSGLGATATASYTVAGAPSVTLSSDKSTYTRNQTVRVTARVVAGGQPLSGATVGFVVTRPNGTRASGSATTAADGTAVYQLRLKARDPLGTYSATAATTVAGVNATAQVNFVVQ
jgi:hypothetical protein